MLKMDSKIFNFKVLQKDFIQTFSISFFSSQAWKNKLFDLNSIEKKFKSI